MIKPGWFFGFDDVQDWLSSRTPSALYAAAMSYRAGLNGRPDPIAAARLLAEAAERGSPEAHYALGSMYRVGEGVQRNPALALNHYKCAAEAGHIGALCELGKCHLDGSGVHRDLDAAFDYFEAAARKGNLDAARQLMSLRALGYAIPLWVDAAVKFDAIFRVRDDASSLRKLRDYRATITAAALQGSQFAALCMAKIYDQGLTIRRSRISALAWARYAYHACTPEMPHDEEASNLLASLELRTSEAEKQSAEARYCAWRRKYGW